jgi:hypothetical protein
MKNEIRNAPTPEEKLLAALGDHLEKLSDKDLARGISATKKILADLDAAPESHPAAPAKPANTRSR